MGQDAMIFVFWMLSFKPTVLFSSFTFIKRLFSSSSLSATRVVSSVYMRLLIFSWQSWFQLVLLSAQRFSWCTLVFRCLQTVRILKAVKLFDRLKNIKIYWLYPSALESEVNNRSNMARSDQISHSVVSDSLRPHELQHARPPCPSPTPGVHSDSCPSSQWCHPAISSSVVLISSRSQSLPASESFPMSQLFAWGGQIWSSGGKKQYGV